MAHSLLFLLYGRVKQCKIILIDMTENNEFSCILSRILRFCYKLNEIFNFFDLIYCSLFEKIYIRLTKNIFIISFSLFTFVDTMALTYNCVF
jgi:hypothetical protein